MSNHAILSPSGSARWSTCTGSVARIEQLIADGKIPAESPDTSFSAEGTEAHSYAAAALVMGYCEEAIPDKIMALHVKGFCDLVTELAGDAEIHVEEQVPLFYSPEDNGTVDAWFYLPGESGRGHIHVVDLKYGQGIAVNAHENTQLAIYAESVIQKHLDGQLSMDAHVTMWIDQPRVREGEPRSSWTITRRELQDFTDNLAGEAENIEAGRTRIKPSDKACQFCRAKPFCAEHAAWKRGDQLQVVERALPTLPDVGTLSDEQLVAVAKVHLDGGFSSWMKKVAETVEQRLLSGQLEGCGLKVVRSKKHKRWTDEKAALQLLKRKLPKEELLNPPKLITPTQAETLLKALNKKEPLAARFNTRFYQLVERPEGGPTLVLDSDPRDSFVRALDTDEFNEAGEDVL